MVSSLTRFTREACTVEKVPRRLEEGEAICSSLKKIEELTPVHLWMTPALARENFALSSWSVAVISPDSLRGAMIAGIRILMTLVVAPPIHVLSSIKAFAVRRRTAQ